MGRPCIAAIAGCATVLFVSLFLFLALLVAHRLPKKTLHLTPSDMVPFDDMPSQWCSEVEVASNRQVNSFLVKGSHLKLDEENRKKYQLDSSLMFFSVYSRASHYFLLPNSTVNINACSSKPGAFLYLFKGREDMRECLQGQQLPNFRLYEEDGEEIQEAFRDYVRNRIKERLEYLQDRIGLEQRVDNDHDDGLKMELSCLWRSLNGKLAEVRDKFTAGLDDVKGQLENMTEELKTAEWKDRLDNVKERVRKRWDEVRNRLKYMNNKLDDIHGKVKFCLGKIPERMKSGLNNLRERLEELKEHLYCVRKAVEQNVDDYSGGIKDRFQEVRDKLDKLKKEVKERLEKVNGRLNRLRERIESIKSFKDDCSAAIMVTKIPEVGEGLNCTDVKGVSVQISETGNYFVAIENFHYAEPNRVNIRLVLNRTVYHLPKDSVVCSRTTKCTVPLDFSTTQHTVVEVDDSVNEANARRLLSVEDFEEAQYMDGKPAKVTVACKPRISFFFLIFAIVPIVSLLGIGVCVGAGCGHKKIRTVIQRSNLDVNIKDPLLSQPVVNYSKGAFSNARAVHGCSEKHPLIQW